MRIVTVTALSALVIAMTASTGVAQPPPPPVAGPPPLQDGGPPPIPPAVREVGPPPGQPDGPPPVPPELRQTGIYYIEKGEAKGPVFEVDELKRLVRTGVITRQTPLWWKGQADWSPADNFPGTKALFDAPENVPKLPENNWAAYMLGTWQATKDYGTIEYVWATTYHPTGKYTSTVQVLGKLDGGRLPMSSATITGDWSVKPMGSDRFTLVIKALDTTNSADFPASEKASSIILRVLGPNALYNETGSLTARRIE